MGASLNLVVLVGNLGKDPELRYSRDGVACATFPLATHRKFKQGDEDKEEVCFIDIVTFRRTAEQCTSFLRSGDQAFVTGRLQQRKWETDDGQKRMIHEVVAEKVTFGIQAAKNREHEAS